MLIFYRTVTNPSPDSEKFARIHQIAAQHITTHSGGSEPSSLMISDPSTHTIMSQALEKLSEPQAKEEVGAVKEKPAAPAREAKNPQNWLHWVIDYFGL